MPAARFFPIKSSSGITVFEVLLIIVCFFILAIFADSFFCHHHSIDTARRASAKNDAVEIATAIVAFQTEYGRLPSTNGEVQDVGGSVLEALTGRNTTLNPRQIVFLEVEPARKGRGGSRDGAFVDPWGVPYKMKLDIDGDNRITNVGPASSPTARVNYRIVAVWNDPDLSDLKNTRRAVTSWD